MIGDQWTCPECGWANFFMRTKCRECRKPKPPDAKIEPALAVMNKIHAVSRVDAQRQKPQNN